MPWRSPPSPNSLFKGVGSLNQRLLAKVFSYLGLFKMECWAILVHNSYWKATRGSLTCVPSCTPFFLRKMSALKQAETNMDSKVANSIRKPAGSENPETQRKPFRFHQPIRTSTLSSLSELYRPDLWVRPGGIKMVEWQAQILGGFLLPC